MDPCYAFLALSAFLAVAAFIAWRYGSELPAEEHLAVAYFGIDRWIWIYGAGAVLSLVGAACFWPHE